MKGPQLSDNLFSVDLSVNHVDSISWDQTALSVTSEASEKKRNWEIWKKTQREVSNGCPFNYGSFSLIHLAQVITDSNDMIQTDAGI